MLYAGYNYCTSEKKHKYITTKKLIFVQKSYNGHTVTTHTK